VESCVFHRNGLRNFLALWLCLAGHATAWAAQVYQVAEDQSQWIITQERNRSWGIGDPVVARRQDSLLAVGVVEAANDGAALVSVQRRGPEPVVVGDVVEYARDSSQVIEVISAGTEFWVTHPAANSWYAGDGVCVARGDVSVGCGKVTQVTPEKARIRLTGATQWAAVGDYVRPAFLETAVLSIDKESNSVQVRQGIYEKWREGDRICAMNGGKEAACGDIAQQNDIAAAFRADRSVENIEVGSWARGRPKTSIVYQVAADQSAIVATHDLSAPWKPGDALCVQRRGYEIACGKVRQANELAALVEIMQKSEAAIVVGESVREAGAGNSEALQKPPVLAATPPNAPAALAEGEDDERDPAAQIEVSQMVGPPKMGNVLAGANYVFPGARYEQALGQHWSIGAGALLVAYPVAGGTLKGTGITGNISYYEAGWFRGLWLYAGAGMLNLKAALNGVEEPLSTLLLSGASGWRFQWENGLNFGFAVGLNYLTKVQTPSVPLDTSRLLPSVVIDFGFAF